MNNLQYFNNSTQAVLKKDPKLKRANVVADALAIIRHEISTDELFVDKVAATDYRDFLAKSRKYIASLNLPVNSASLNGIMIPSPVDLSTEVMQLLGREQYSLMTAVSDGRISDQTKSIFNAMLEMGTRYTRYHSVLLESTAVYMDTSLPSVKRTLQQLEYLSKTHEDKSYGINMQPMSSLILLVPMNESGFGIISSALQFWCGFQGNLRLSIVFKGDGGQEPNKVNTCAEPEDSKHHLAQTLLSYLKDMETMVEAQVRAIASVFEILRNSLAIECILKNHECQLSEFSILEAGHLDMVKGVIARLHDDLTRCSTPSSMNFERGNALAASLEIPPESYAIVLNGRVQQLTLPLEVADFALLNEIESTKITKPLIAILAESENAVSADTLVDIVSFCGRYSGSSSSRVDVASILHDSDLSDAEYIFHVNPESTKASNDVSIYFVVDPLTIAAQRAISVMRLVRDNLQLPFTVILVPLSQYETFPLQNFYRFVLSPDDETPAAIFNDLPKNHILTVRPDVPESWNTQALIATQDIDNLRCDAVSCGDGGTKTSKVVYKLKSLLIAGQCFESTDRGRSMPPNGLQLVLSTNSSDGSLLQTDSLVMQNYGYFQFQASPGLW